MLFLKPGKGSGRCRRLAGAGVGAGHLHDHFHVAAGRDLALGGDRHVAFLGGHRAVHRHVDRLPVGGTGAGNVDLAASNVLLRPLALAAVARTLGEFGRDIFLVDLLLRCLLYTSPSPRDRTSSRMPSSA